MALNEDDRDLPKDEARWPLVVALARPFAAIGRAVIRWTDDLAPRPFSSSWRS